VGKKRKFETTNSQAHIQQVIISIGLAAMVLGSFYVGFKLARKITRNFAKKV
jgi:hypothetical protein